MIDGYLLRVGTREILFWKDPKDGWVMDGKKLQKFEASWGPHTLVSHILLFKVEDFVPGETPTSVSLVYVMEDDDREMYYYLVVELMKIAAKNWKLFSNDKDCTDLLKEVVSALMNIGGCHYVYADDFSVESFREKVDDFISDVNDDEVDEGDMKKRLLDLNEAIPRRGYGRIWGK